MIKKIALAGLLVVSALQANEDYLTLQVKNTKIDGFLKNTPMVGFNYIIKYDVKNTDNLQLRLNIEANIGKGDLEQNNTSVNTAEVAFGLAPTYQFDNGFAVYVGAKIGGYTYSENGFDTNHGKYEVLGVGGIEYLKKQFGAGLSYERGNVKFKNTEKDDSYTISSVSAYFRYSF